VYDSAVGNPAKRLLIMVGPGGKRNTDTEVRVFFYSKEEKEDHCCVQPFGHFLRPSGFFFWSLPY
jgi:hypothetical protein